MSGPQFIYLSHLCLILCKKYLVFGGEESSVWFNNGSKQLYRERELRNPRGTVARQASSQQSSICSTRGERTPTLHQRENCGNTSNSVFKKASIFHVSCARLGLPSVHRAFGRQRNRARACPGLRGERPQDTHTSPANPEGNKGAFQTEKAICLRNVLSLSLTRCSRASLSKK